MEELPPLELSDEDLRLLARYGGIKELREVRPPWLVLLLGLGAAVAILVIVVAFLGLHVALAGGLLEGAGRLAQWAGASTGGKAVLVGSVLAIGVALYLFRLKLRVMYGLTEVFAALFIAWYGATASTVTASGVSLLGAAYIVVRGVDNIMVGAKDNQAKTEAKRLASPDHTDRAKYVALLDRMQMHAAAEERLRAEAQAPERQRP